MEVTVNVGNVLSFLILGWTPKADDDVTVIGHSRFAYLSAKDPGHVFLEAARWHDAAYTTAAAIQKEWPRWRVDAHFLGMMLDISKGHSELTKEALTLYLTVRLWGDSLWEGEVDEGSDKAEKTVDSADCLRYIRELSLSMVEQDKKLARMQEVIDLLHRNHNTLATLVSAFE